MVARIGRSVLDTDRRELLRDGAPVHLSPKAYELLVLLVEQGPKAVSKLDIHEALWPRTFVVESNLRALVTEVREALQDDGRNPSFIRTVHRFGYAFRPGVTLPAGPGAGAAGPRAAVVHRLVSEGHDFPLAEGSNVLGRGGQAAVWIGHSSISRRHAVITVSGARAVLHDLGSKNGTYWNGERVVEPVVLADGDEVRVGNLHYVFRSTAVQATTRTTPREPAD